MLGRTIKIVHKERYKGKGIVIVRISWDRDVIQLSSFFGSMFGTYHNGYVQTKRKFSYQTVANQFSSVELIFSGKLDVENAPKDRFFGFDSNHSYNHRKPKSKTKKVVLENARKLAEEMIEKGY